MPEHPESVPPSHRWQIKGTLLENNPKVDIWDMVRMIATARILMPKSMVRLSAGRTDMSVAEQASFALWPVLILYSQVKIAYNAQPFFLKKIM